MRTPMKLSLALVILAAHATAADIYVCDAPRTKPGGPSCDYTSAQIQLALDRAGDGDTIYLQEGITYRDAILRRVHASPVTVTSMKFDWLPCPNCRITPSYFPLMPVLSPGPTNFNGPALGGQLDGSGNSPAGWNFTGVAFWAGAGRGADLTYHSYSGSLIHTGGQMWEAFQFDGVSTTATAAAGASSITITGRAVSNQDIGRTLRVRGGSQFIPGDYVVQSVSGQTWNLDRPVASSAASGLTGDAGWLILNDNNQPNRITFDRIFTRDDLDDSISWQNAVRFNGYNLTLKNSFIWPVFCQGVECHGASIATASNLGPLTYSNNFLSAGSIPLFAGGTDADYLGGIRPDVVARYNYLFRPLKWWPGASNPQRAYYLANGSKTVCSKNIGEFKGLYRGLLEYNVHENIWEDNFCFGQYFAFTNSVRQTTWYSPAKGGVWGASLWMDTITASGSNFSLTQGSRGWLTLRPGQAVCPIVSNVFYCRQVATFDINTHSGTVTQPFPLASSANPAWLYASDPTPAVLDLTIQNSVFRNAGSGPSMLLRDMAVLDGGDMGRVRRSTIQNNLFETTLGVTSTYGLLVATQEQNSSNATAVGGGPLTYEFNTYNFPATAKPTYWNTSQALPVAKIQDLSVRSNVFPVGADDGAGNIYALGVTDVGFNNWCDLESVAAGTVRLQTNYLFAAARQSGCTYASVSGNIASANAVRYIAGTYKLVPGSLLSRAGFDHADIGVLYDRLPLIRNLRVSASSRSAVLDFDLAGPIADAGASQPCVLEVSTDSNLESYLGSYSVIPDLDPRYFKQPDSSARSNPALPAVVSAAGHVSWPVGNAATVGGDDGVSHDLSLTPATQYFGRLQCYGDTQAFRFATAAATSSSTVQSMQFTVPSGIETVRVDYGPSAALGASVSAAAGPSGYAAIQIPVSPGQFLYSRYSYLDASSRTVYQSPVGLTLP